MKLKSRGLSTRVQQDHNNYQQTMVGTKHSLQLQMGTENGNRVIFSEGHNHALTWLPILRVRSPQDARMLSYTNAALGT